jgi:outer membrane protein TolC
MREQERAALERLKLFMNSPTAPVGRDDVIVAAESLETPLLQADLEQSIKIALAKRPEMRNADLAVRTGEARRSFARHNLLPELSVGGSIRRNDGHTSTPVSTSNNDYLGNDWTLGVSFSMPIGNMESRARLRRSESELAQSIDEKLGTKSAVITEVKIAVRTLELLVSEIPVSHQAVEAARKVVAGEWARFEVNQVGNRDLLQAQDLLATAQRSHAQSLARYNIALARLFAAEGTLLEKLGCEFK